MKAPTSILLATLASFAILSTNAFAQESDNPFQRSAAIARKGGVQGGGGDTATEGRIHEIRRDLIKWIAKGGARGLDFSKSRAQLTYDEYLAGDSTRGLFGMNDILVDGAVVINAIRESEQRMDDEEMNTSVEGFPKTCKGFISKKDGRPHMLCNADRFWDLKPGWTKEQLEAEQYRQVHHEYASLGRLEQNAGSDSDTSLSDQITTFLKHEIVLRLSVAEPLASDTPDSFVLKRDFKLRTASSSTHRILKKGTLLTPLTPIWNERSYDSGSVSFRTFRIPNCLNSGNKASYTRKKSATGALFDREGYVRLELENCDLTVSFVLPEEGRKAFFKYVANEVLP